MYGGAAAVLLVPAVLTAVLLVRWAAVLLLLTVPAVRQALPPLSAGELGRS